MFKLASRTIHVYRIMRSIEQVLDGHYETGQREYYSFYPVYLLLTVLWIFRNFSSL